MDTTDVKTEEAVPVPSQGTEQPITDVSEDVKTPAVEGQVDQSVYEKVREAMKSERTEKKAEKARNSELEARIAELESQNPQQETPKEYGSYEAKVDVLTLMNKDPFFKENTDLIESKMSENPSMDARTALREVKAEFFDRIQKESNPVEVNKPLTQQRPTAAAEPTQVANDVKLKDYLAGTAEMNPMQKRAIENVMPQQR